MFSTIPVDWNFRNSNTMKFFFFLISSKGYIKFIDTGYERGKKTETILKSYTESEKRRPSFDYILTNQGYK